MVTYIFAEEAKKARMSVTQKLRRLYMELGRQFSATKYLSIYPY